MKPIRDDNVELDALFLTRGEVAKLLKCSERHVARMERQGLIPEPVSLGSRCVRHSIKKIEAWMDAGCPAIAV